MMSCLVANSLNGCSCSCFHSLPFQVHAGTHGHYKERGSAFVRDPPTQAINSIEGEASKQGPGFECPLLRGGHEADGVSKGSRRDRRRHNLLCAFLSVSKRKSKQGPEVGSFQRRRVPLTWMTTLSISCDRDTQEEPLTYHPFSSSGC